MNVYKTFFKILWKQKGQIIMYIVIFTVIVNLVSSQSIKENKFEQNRYKVTIFDHDNSVLSKSIISYMESINDIKDISSEDISTIQDELYNRNIDCAITIPKDFEKKLTKDNASKMLEVSGIDNTIKYNTIKSQLNGYVDTLATYLAAGIDIKKAVEFADNTVKKEINVKLIDGSESTENTKLYYAFVYVAYVFILIMMVAIGPIIIVFKKKNIKDRMMCSPYSLAKTDIEIYLGMISVGVGICVLFSILAMTIVGNDILSCRGALAIGNMFCFALLSLAITFVVGQFVTKVNSLSMISNIIGLGCSFLCGVFVPLSYLSDGVKSIARFLPSYWYVRALEDIDKYEVGTSVTNIIGFMGVEIGYAVLLVVVGSIVNVKIKKNKMA